MEDTIEICAGCGKMPRSIDNSNGSFMCSRCGYRATTMVSGEQYEKIVTDLDKKFHERMLKSRFEAVAGEPLRSVKPKKTAKKTVAKKSKKAPAKKSKKKR